MTKLEKAKQIVKENAHFGDCGIFDTRNIAGDRMMNLYAGSDGLMIDVCIVWGYFEVFGLTREEFAELKKYYKTLPAVCETYKQLEKD